MVNNNTTYNNIDPKAFAEAIVSAEKTDRVHKGEILEKLLDHIERSNIGSISELMLDIRHGMGFSDNEVSEVLCVAAEYQKILGSHIYILQNGLMPKEKVERYKLLDTKLDDLKDSLNTHTVNTLYHNRVLTLGDLLNFLDRNGVKGFRHMRNIGSQTYDIVIGYLKDNGLYKESWEEA